MTKTGWLKGQWATLPPDDSPLLGSRGRIWETYIILSAICQNTAFWTACRYENWEQPVLIIHDRSSVPVTVAEKSSDYVIIHDLTCQNGGTANHRIFVHAKSLAAISALCPFLLSADLTHTAKLLYTLLLDRATLSQKNNWVDAKGRVYVLYPIIHLAKDLRCSTSSVTRALTELENADLLERLHTGFSKPSQILLKIPVGMQKCTSNQRNKNNLNDNHLIRANNTRLSFGEYQNIFLTEKEYKRLKVDFAGLDTLIEQLSAYIQSTGKKYADHAATLRIWAKRQQSEKKTAPGIPDYTFAKGESL